MSDTALRHQIEVTLTIPVKVPGADGKEAERSKIVLQRPKLRHTKRLAALIGADVLEALLSGDSDIASAVETAKIEGRKLMLDVLGKLMDTDRLDGLTALIADLCGEDKVTIDDIDLVDLPAVAAGFAGFFPALQSVMSGLSQAISSPSAAAIPAP